MKSDPELSTRSWRTCLHCNCKNFTVKSILFSVDFKEETVEVMSDAFVCDDCGEPLMDSTQMDALRRLTADKYKSTHGLLQSHEIIAIRERLRMPFVEFAELLRITPKELRRYETYFVQPKEIDEAIKKVIYLTEKITIIN